MSNLPSFRPRAAMGWTAQNGEVHPTQQFLRYLEGLARKADANGSELAGLPFAMVGVGVTQGAEALPTVATEQAQSGGFSTVFADNETFEFEVI